VKRIRECSLESWERPRKTQTLRYRSKDFASRLILFASANSVCSLIITLGVRLDIHRQHHIVADVVILVRLEVVNKVDALIVINERISNNFMLWIV